MTTTRWAVLLKTGATPHLPEIYGPFDDEADAKTFADFMTAEVDPAEPVKVRSANQELLAYWRNEKAGEDAAADLRPEQWPPKPGSVWLDNDGDRWVCVPMYGGTTEPYLVGLSKPGDDNADEIWRKHGPLLHDRHIPTSVGEPPL